MHKFNEQSCTVDFIKNFLYKYWLPIYDTAQPGDYIVKDYMYVYNNKLIRCTKSGVVGRSEYHSADFNTNDWAKFDIIRDYKLGGRYRFSSDNFISNSEYYDEFIHNRLGKFVRSYSDITGIDLRPYFNCNCNKYLTNIYVEKVQNADSVDQYQILDGANKYRVSIVPIRFNHTYTIACDCPSKVICVPVFYSNDRKLIIKTSTEDRDISTEFFETTNQLWSFQFMSYSHPNEIYVSCKGEVSEKYYKYQHNLYLLIQTPKNNNSALTVLEGTYQNLDNKKIIGMDHLYDMTEYQLNKILRSKLRLLQFNTNESYPFSNRLLEYLFDMVIDYTWKLDSNIEKVQSILPNARLDKFQGAWDNLTRFRLHEYSKEYAQTNKLDFCGHLDKDTEGAVVKVSDKINGGF